MRTTLAPLMVAAALMLGAQAVHAADTVRPEVGEPLQKAQTLLQSRKYKDALQQVDAASKVGGLTPYESYIVERMRAAAATGAGETGTAIKAYEAALASPQMPAAEKLKTYDVIAKLAYGAKNYAKVTEYVGKYRAAGGNDPQTLGLEMQAKYLGGDLAGAQRELSGQIADLEKAGKRPSETQLQMLASIATKQNNTNAYIGALEKLVAYYPKDNYWLDLIIRTSNKPGFSDRLALDIYRVKKMTGTLEKTSDFMEAAQLALQAGLPGEADQYVKLGYEKKLLGSGSDAARHQRLKDLVAKKIAEDKAALAQTDKEAAAEATGDALVSAGLDHVGYGDYAAGISLMQKGIAKGSLKKPEDAKLHLGYAQLVAGKKDEAIKTLRSVQGKDGTTDMARLYQLAAR